MKHLLPALIFLVLPFIGNGQKDTIRGVIFDRLIVIPTDAIGIGGELIIGNTYGSNFTSDTARIIYLYSDTTELTAVPDKIYHRDSPLHFKRSRICYWDYGYHVYSWYERKEYFLDGKKDKIPTNIIIWNYFKIK